MIVFDQDSVKSARNRHIVGAKVVAQRRALRLRNFAYARKAREALSQAAHKCRRSSFIVTLRFGIEERCRNVLHLKAGIDRLCVVKPA